MSLYLTVFPNQKNNCKSSKWQKKLENAPLTCCGITLFLQIIFYRFKSHWEKVQKIFTLCGEWLLGFVSQKVLANRYGNSIYNIFTFCIIILDRTGLRGGGWGAGAGGHSGGRMIEGGGWGLDCTAGSPWGRSTESVDFYISWPQSNDWYRGHTEFFQYFAYWVSSHRDKGAARHIIDMIWLYPQGADPHPPFLYARKGR